ncbi:MAG: hypothetical protein GWO16_12215 [Gammaproteobacteria bacterium]|nr:hypothetical protein [Gammaproteobacteria bacterium]
MSEINRLRHEIRELWQLIGLARGNTPDLRLARRCLRHCLEMRLERFNQLV